MELLPHHPGRKGAQSLDLGDEPLYARPAGTFLVERSRQERFKPPETLFKIPRPGGLGLPQERGFEPPEECDPEPAQGEGSLHGRGLRPATPRPPASWIQRNLGALGARLPHVLREGGHQGSALGAF